MLKVLAACGSGMGSSMVIKMKIEKALTFFGQKDFKVDYCSISEAKSRAVNYDIVVASDHLIHELDGRTRGKQIGLNNLMNDDEIKEKLSKVL